MPYGDAKDWYESSPNNAGNWYADRLRQQSFQSPEMFGVSHQGIADARQLSADSYARQQAQTANMRNLALGYGPSVAAIQGQAANDAAMRSMAGGSPMSLRAAFMSGGLDRNTAAAGAARAQEIGQAQKGWAGGAAAQRGGSLQDYNQGLSSAYGASKLNLDQQQQNLERLLKMQQLAYGGNQAEASFVSDLGDIDLGLYMDSLARNRQMQATAIQAAATGTQTLADYGRSLQRDSDDGTSNGRGK